MNRPVTSHEKFAKLLKRHSSSIPTKFRDKIQEGNQMYQALKYSELSNYNPELNQKENLVENIPYKRRIDAGYFNKSAQLTNEMIVSKQEYSAIHEQKGGFFDS